MTERKVSAQDKLHVVLFVEVTIKNEYDEYKSKS